MLTNNHVASKQKLHRLYRKMTIYQFWSFFYIIYTVFLFRYNIFGSTFKRSYIQICTRLFVFRILKLSYIKPSYKEVPLYFLPYLCFSLQPQVKSKDKHSSANKEAVSEIYKRKDYGWLDIKDKDTAKTQTPPKVPKNTNGGFGGFKKGFLSGSKPKSKPVKTDKGSASVSSTEQKSKSTLEDIPLIKKEDHTETEELKLPEVQEKKEEASDDLMKNQSKTDFSTGYQGCVQKYKVIGNFVLDSCT